MGTWTTTRPHHVRPVVRGHSLMVVRRVAAAVPVDSSTTMRTRQPPAKAVERGAIPAHAPAFSRAILLLLLLEVPRMMDLEAPAPAIHGQGIHVRNAHRDGSIWTRTRRLRARPAQVAAGRQAGCSRSVSSVLPAWPIQTQLLALARLSARRHRVCCARPAAFRTRHPRNALLAQEARTITTAMLPLRASPVPLVNFRPEARLRARAVLLGKLTTTQTRPLPACTVHSRPSQRLGRRNASPVRRGSQIRITMLVHPVTSAHRTHTRPLALSAVAAALMGHMTMMLTRRRRVSHFSCGSPET